MRLVKKIEVFETPRDWEHVTSLREMIIPLNIEAADPMPFDEVMELVEGIKFNNGLGETICIGWTKEVQEALGLPFECLDNQMKMIVQQNKTIITHRARLQRLNAMTLWQRMKFCVTGDLPA